MEIYSEEPMDVDLSSGSVQFMDISYSVAEENEPPAAVMKHIDLTEDNGLKCSSNNAIIKKYHINLPNHSKSGVLSFQNKLLLSVMLAVGISIITYYIFDINCRDVDLENLKKSLTQSIYGQSHAINIVTNTLKSEERNKILLFYGPSGVGKTLMASIIIDNIGFSSNTYHYTMPTFLNTFSSEQMIGMTICDTTMIILDDLTVKDMPLINGHISEVIAKSENLNKNTTIILIFSCSTVEKLMHRCDKNLEIEMNKSFSDMNILTQLVKFEPLNDEHLRSCILNEARNRKIEKNEMEKLTKLFNVSLDGCKGVHTKLKWLNIA